MPEMDNKVRNQIINAALQIFARYGFRKTTMDDIAKKSNRAKSSLYHYFSSKEDIFKAVVEKEGNILRSAVLNAIAKKKLPTDKLRVYVKTRMEALNRMANIYNAFQDEYLENYKFIQSLRSQYDNFEIETIKKILKQGIDQGIFKIDDLHLTAFTIVIGMKGLEYYWATEKDMRRLNRNIDTLFDLLFNGIQKR